MKIKQHRRVPRVNQVRLQAEPMRIFLTSSVELVLERGDRLKDVARAIRPHMRWFDNKTLRRIVAYYFAMGERTAQDRLTESWQVEEYRRDPDRRYLEGILEK